ncbi:50S ribosomal protein L11 methyltransferase [bacterium]|nr:50S ribosomal protein L11 methyltransferase [bacterium]
MNYLEVAFTVPAPAAEAVAWALTEHGLPGVVVGERRPEDPISEHAVLKAYLPQLDAAPDLAALEAAARQAIASVQLEGDVTLATRVVPEEDWATSWQQYWHVQRIGERLVVRPSWEEYTPAADDVVITLDPKMAFGTGTHPTTRLCMRALERLAAKGPLGHVYDVGAGSGILAIAALLLGAPDAIAVDTDPVAVAASEENGVINGVADRLVNRVGSAGDLPGQAELVFANILAEVIVELADALYAVTAPGGTLIASGIIERKADMVAEALKAAGYQVIEREPEGEWVGLTAVRPA